MHSTGSRKFRSKAAPNPQSLFLKSPVHLLRPARFSLGEKKKRKRSVVDRLPCGSRECIVVVPAGEQRGALSRLFSPLVLPKSRPTVYHRLSPPCLCPSPSMAPFARPLLGLDLTRLLIFSDWQRLILKQNVVELIGQPPLCLSLVWDQINPRSC